MTLMKITSWNCRGFRRKKKEEALKDIIRTSKTNVILLQETKMDSQALLKTMQVVWRNSQGTAENARGASGGLGTVWNTNKFELISADSTTHWIHTKLLHKATDRLVSLFNIYVPQILLEKQQCWETLKDYLQHNDLDNIILGGGP